MNDKNKTKPELIKELTQLRQEASELQGSLARQEAILEAIGDPVSIQDTDFRVLYQNAAHKKLVGDQVGKYCYKAYSKRDEICIECPLVLSFKDSRIHTAQKKGGNTETGPMHVEITASPLRDQEGKVIAGIEVVRNISERIKAQQALVAAEAKFRSIVEQSMVGIYIIKDNKFSYINPKFAEIFGYTADEIISSKTVPDLVYEEDRTLVAENIRKRLTGEQKSIHYTFRGQKKDGTVIDIEVHGTKVDSDGSVSIIGTLLDTTENKKAGVMDSIGLLAGGIAHNFNNILTAIAGNLSLAKMYAKPGQEVFDILSEAEKATLRAKNLVYQLLTFSKGGLPIKKPVSLAKLAQDAADFALSGSDIKLDLSVQDDLWMVNADEIQISQVITNLAENARQAMNKGGSIEITMQNVLIDQISALPLKQGGYVKIAVADQGTGISEDQIRKVFDPFFTTKKEGTGLGLAASYSIIKKHDGHITVQSTPGSGTVFEVYLPAHQDKKADEESDDRRPRIKRGKILVMDDEEIVRDVVARMLEQCGYSAEFARDGAEAIELYRSSRESETPFEAVILDLIVPEKMGGKEAMEKLLEIDSEVKAIVSSGYSNDPVMANFKEYGFKSVLSKPYKMEDLCRSLDALLNRT